MNLSEIVELVTNSRNSDWHRIDCSIAPSYKNQLEFIDGTLNYASHNGSAVYISDISITVCWGLDFPGAQGTIQVDEDWTNSFSDHSASRHYADVFYKNALVYRKSYVLVDGARFMVPYPNHGPDGSRHTSRQKFDFIKGLNRVADIGDSSMEAYYEHGYTQNVAIIEGGEDLL